MSADPDRLTADLEWAVHYALFDGLPDDLPHWAQELCFADFRDALRRTNDDRERCALGRRYRAAYADR